VALRGELRRIASIALVASFVKGEDTGSNAVLAARCVDELFEQVRAEDEVGAFNGWLERLVVAVVDKVASPMAADKTRAIVVAETESADSGCWR
jgi:hypothetical protein